jgi:hypothetical protein
MLRKAIPILFAVLLFSPAAMAKDDETYLGFKAIMSPWGSVDYETSREKDDLEFGYGIGFWAEQSVFSFLGLGGALEYRRFKMESYDEQGSALHLDPMVRLYIPGNTFEPYLKAQFGLTLMWPPDEPEETDFGPGFNWMGMLGLALRWDSIGVFAEIGMGQTRAESYRHASGTDLEVVFDISHLDTNFGLLLIF